MPVRLRDLASCRAGDKGNIATLSVIPYDDADYPLLVRELTADRVRAGVGARHQQLLPGPDEIHAPVRQDVAHLDAVADSDMRRPDALDLRTKRRSRRTLPVGHIGTVAVVTDISRAAPAPAAGSSATCRACRARARW